jgi:hypothetical protein
MSAPFIITRMNYHTVRNRLIDLSKPIAKGWDCPHCGKKPEGVEVQSDGRKWSKATEFFLAPHTCKGGTVEGGYAENMWEALSYYWGPWVNEQRKIIANPPAVVKPKKIKSFWQKLLTGWN